MSLFYSEPYKTVPSEQAEAVKLFSNSFHAMKVSFANEVERICSQNSISGSEVMTLFSEDSKLNISSQYLQPGFAWGGGCLGKDLNYLISQDDSARLLRAVSLSNDLQIDHYVKKIISMNSKRIGFFGLSFKQSITDLRESPVLQLIRRLAVHPKVEDIFVYSNAPEQLKELEEAHKNLCLVSEPEKLNEMDVIVYRKCQQNEINQPFKPPVIELS